MKKIWFGSVAATLLAGGALAANPGGTISYTGTESYPPFYLHTFETAGGTVHILDNWSFTTLYTSVSGRQWISYGVSPAHLNLRLDKGSVVGYTSSSRAMPVDGGPNPSFIFNSNYKVTMNALGEVVVEIVPVPGGNFTCLGPKN
jgi:hypothetical protein